jgi:hypothetical protein
LEKTRIMMEFVSQPALQATVSVAVIIAVMWLGFHVAIRLRPTTSKPDTSAVAWAQNFEEMRLEGDIDDAELRKIKAVLGEKRGAMAGAESMAGSRTRQTDKT